MESIYFNQEAERNLIGLAIGFPECVKRVVDIPPDAFYYQEHKAIQEAIRAMNSDGEKVDLITVTNWLTTHQKLDDAGGIVYLTKCCSDAFMPSMEKQYARIVQECHNRRRQRTVAQEYAKRLDGGDDPEESWEWMLRTLGDIKQERETGLISSRDALLATYQKIESDYKQEQQEEGSRRIMSGISSLDNKLGGLSGSKYIAIGARPSVGKSIFALTYCVNAARQGKRVLLVTLEMDEIDITERLLANYGDVSMKKITGAKLEDDDWMGLARGAGQLGNMGLWYSLDANTVEKVRRCAYEIYEGGGLDMIAIDYIQLMDPEEGRGRASRQEEVARISRGLRKLSQELKIPILVLTQLNRQSVSNNFGRKKAVKREPTMSEARESGAIEQDANIFMLLHQPDKDEMKDDDQKEMWETLRDKGLKLMKVIIEKNRQGTSGNVTIAFDGDKMRFLPIVRRVEAPF